MIIDKNIVLLTWVSCSWKTTLQKELLSRGWNRPINFTTRLPRNDWELDEYVFLTREQFDFKFNKWDFLEFTNFNWNKYGVSNTLKQNTKYIIILDAIGRSQVMEQLARKWLQPKTFYLEISEEEQLKRLNDRGSPKEEIENRMKDRLWFHPTPNCVILNWSWSIKTLADIIEQKCE
jgi:guanylate kinase